MNEAQQKEIFEKCPILYRNRNLGPQHNLMCFGFECGPGWFDLILELSVAIEAIAQRMKAEGTEENRLPYAMQVTEKFGELRFYVGNEYHEFSHLIEAAEARSEEICEECGKPGSLRKKDGWYSTACDACFEKR